MAAVRRNSRWLIDLVVALSAIFIIMIGLTLRSNRQTRQLQQAQSELKENEARFRSYFELPLIGICVTSPEKGWIEVNDRLCEMLGYSREELTQFSWADLTSPDDLKLDVQQFERLLKGEIEGYSLDKRFIRKNGTSIWTSLAVRCVRKPDHSVDYFVGLIQDITDRKQADLEVRESAERYGAVIQTAMDGFACLDLQGNLTEVNDAYCRMCGYDRQSLLKMKISDLDVAEAASDTSDRIQKILAEGGDRFETRHRHKDGHQYDVEVSVRYLPEKGGQMFTFTRDITEKKRAEKDLKNANEHLAATLGALPDLLFEVDTDGIIHDFRSPAPEMLYAPPETFMGKMFEQVLPPDASRIIRQAVREAGKTGYYHGATYSLQMPTGECWFELSISLKGDPRANPAHFIALARNINERKQADQAIKKERGMLRLILDSAAEAIYGLDTEGKCTFCNRACLEILGYEDQQELIGKDMHLQIHHTLADGSSFPIENCRIYHAFHRREGAHVDDELLWRKDGSSFQAEYWSYPQWQDGQVVGAVVTFIDITERRKTEAGKIKLTAQLQQSQKLDSIGQLAGGTAHDFNNILAAIMMNIGFVELKPNLDEEVLKSIQDLQRDAQRAADLTNQLLIFSRRSVLETKVLNLNDAVSNIIKMLTRLIGEHISPRFDCREGLPSIEADPGMLEQVLMNPSLNARDAMPKAGRLTISTEAIELKAERAAANPDARPGPFRGDMKRSWWLRMSTVSAGCS
jgi:PAS domain S-box-containing protein